MATKLTKAEKANAEALSMGRIENRAFNSGEARSALLAEVANVCGAKPVLALYEKARLAIVVGFMASALARKGDNRTEAVLRAHCRDRILNYQGADGKGKLRQGQKGRRTQTEEDAYASARVLVSRIFSDAGVKVPTKSGSNSNSKAKAAAKKGASGKRTNANDKSAANANDRPAVRKFGSAEKFVEYALIQGKAMQGSLNKSAAIVPERMGTAINHFLTEAIAVAEELGMSV